MPAPPSSSGSRSQPTSSQPHTTHNPPTKLPSTQPVAIDSRPASNPAANRAALQNITNTNTTATSATGKRAQSTADEASRRKKRRHLPTESQSQEEAEDVPAAPITTSTASEVESQSSIEELPVVEEETTEHWLDDDNAETDLQRSKHNDWPDRKIHSLFKHVVQPRTTKQQRASALTAYIEIGDYFHQLQLHKQCIRYMREALSLVLLTAIRENIVYIYQRLAESYRELGSNPQGEVGERRSAFAEAVVQCQNHIDTSMKWMKSSNPEYVRDGNRNVVNAYYNMSDIYLRLCDFEVEHGKKQEAHRHAVDYAKRAATVLQLLDGKYRERKRVIGNIYQLQAQILQQEMELLKQEAEYKQQQLLVKWMTDNASTTSTAASQTLLPASAVANHLVLSTPHLQQQITDLHKRAIKHITDAEGCAKDDLMYLSIYVGVKGGIHATAGCYSDAVKACQRQYDLASADSDELGAISSIRTRTEYLLKANQYTDAQTAAKEYITIYNGASAEVKATERVHVSHIKYMYSQAMKYSVQDKLSIMLAAYGKACNDANGEAVDADLKQLQHLRTIATYCDVQSERGFHSSWHTEQAAKAYMRMERTATRLQLRLADAAAATSDADRSAAIRTCAEAYQLCACAYGNWLLHTTQQAYRIQAHQNDQQQSATKALAARVHQLLQQSASLYKDINDSLANVIARYSAIDYAIESHCLQSDVESFMATVRELLDDVERLPNTLALQQWICQCVDVVNEQFIHQLQEQIKQQQAADTVDLTLIEAHQATIQHFREMKELWAMHEQELQAQLQQQPERKVEGQAMRYTAEQEQVITQIAKFEGALRTAAVGEAAEDGDDDDSDADDDNDQIVVPDELTSRERQLLQAGLNPFENGESSSSSDDDNGPVEHRATRQSTTPPERRQRNSNSPNVNRVDDMRRKQQETKDRATAQAERAAERQRKHERRQQQRQRNADLDAVGGAESSDEEVQTSLRRYIDVGDRAERSQPAPRRRAAIEVSSEDDTDMSPRRAHSRPRYGAEEQALREQSRSYNTSHQRPTNAIEINVLGAGNDWGAARRYNARYAYNRHSSSAHQQRLKVAQNGRVAYQYSFNNAHAQLPTRSPQTIATQQPQSYAPASTTRAAHPFAVSNQQPRVTLNIHQQLHAPVPQSALQHSTAGLASIIQEFDRYDAVTSHLQAHLGSSVVPPPAPSAAVAPAVQATRPVQQVATRPQVVAPQPVQAQPPPAPAPSKPQHYGKVTVTVNNTTWTQDIDHPEYKIASLFSQIERCYHQRTDDYVQIKAFQQTRAHVLWDRTQQCQTDVIWRTEPANAPDPPQLVAVVDTSAVISLVDKFALQCRKRGCDPHPEYVRWLRDLTMGAGVTTIQRLKLPVFAGVRSAVVAALLHVVASDNTLQSLDLSNTVLDADTVNEVSKLMSHSTVAGLTTLLLSHIPLSAERWSELLAGVSKLPLLQHLDLSFTNISDSHLVALHAIMQRNTLRTLTLNHSKLVCRTDDSSNQLAAGLSSCTAVQELSLIGAELSPAALHALLVQLKSCSQLTTLHLSDIRCMTAKPAVLPSQTTQLPDTFAASAQRSDILRALSDLLRPNSTFNGLKIVSLYGWEDGSGGALSAMLCQAIMFNGCELQDLMLGANSITTHYQRAERT